MSLSIRRTAQFKKDYKRMVKRGAPAGSAWLCVSQGGAWVRGGVYGR